MQGSSIWAKLQKTHAVLDFKARFHICCCLKGSALQEGVQLRGAENAPKWTNNITQEVCFKAAKRQERLTSARLIASWRQQARTAAKMAPHNARHTVPIQNTSSNLNAVGNAIHPRKDTIN